MITISSTRIYLDTLSEKERLCLFQTREWYTRAKEKLYNWKYDKAFLDKWHDNETADIKAYLKSLHCEPQDYYITSLMSHTNGMISSEKELVKLYDTEHQARIKNIHRKLKSLRKRLTMLKNQKHTVVLWTKKHRTSSKPKAVKVYKDFEKYISDKKSLCEIYQFECWVDRETRRVSARIHRIEEKERRLEQRHARLPKRATFGSRAFYKTKDTTDINHDVWKEERQRRRNKTILFSGRFDSKTKNWLVSYDFQKQSMDITLMDRTILHLPNVVFPYRGDELIRVLTHQKEAGWSVGYWMEFLQDHKGRDYILMKASFEEHQDVEHRNDCTNTGIIGIDLNADRISLADIDEHGCLKETKDLFFNLKGKTSSQRKDILGRVCAEAVRYAKEQKKPIGMEDVDLVLKRASMAYGNKNSNRVVSSFAYRQMTQLIVGNAARNDVAVRKVNPAYTSLIGKMKYMKLIGRDVHNAAAFVIGRRAMGYREKIPKYLKDCIPQDRKSRHRWSQFAYLKPTADEKRKPFFFQTLPSFEGVKKFRQPDKK